MCLLFQSLPFLHTLCFNYQFRNLDFFFKCSVFSWRFVTSVCWFVAAWSWWIIADLSNTWCSSSYRHIWESRADSCLPLCFSILQQIRNLLFECTQVMLYIKPFFNCFLCIRFSIELYSLCTSNIILKMWSGCCIWSQTDSKFLKEYSIYSTTLDFLIIVLVSLESFFSSSFNWYAVHLGGALVFLLPNSL